MPKVMLVALMAAFLLLGGTVVSTAHATPLGPAATLPTPTHNYSPVELSSASVGRADALADVALGAAAGTGVVGG
jgi:hypothetical protein